MDHPIDILEDIFQQVAANNNLELSDDFEEALQDYRKYVDQEL